MNAKTEGTLTSLKMLSAMEREMHERATKVGAHILGVHALMVAGVIENAAEFIEEQHKEISDLKAQLAATSTPSLDAEQRVFIVGNPSQEFIILSEIANGYLITPFPTNKSKPLEDVRIVARDRVVFTDPAASSTFNA